MVQQLYANIYKHVNKAIKTAARDIVLHGIASQSNRPSIINGVRFCDCCSNINCHLSRSKKSFKYQFYLNFNWFPLIDLMRFVWEIPSFHEWSVAKRVERRWISLTSGWNPRSSIRTSASTCFFRFNLKTKHVDFAWFYDRIILGMRLLFQNLVYKPYMQLQVFIKRRKETKDKKWLTIR
jgi:hypothetical protein